MRRTIGASASAIPHVDIAPKVVRVPGFLERLQQALAHRYAVERELGQGGMATVYLASDLRHERVVAVKVLRPELAAALGPERFLREITTTAQLAHPHILPLLDSGEADGTLFYVMPCVEGESLRGRLEREKQLPLDDAVQITREVADALSYAHSHGVIHRDIKPENILLQGGHAVVADFGIARAVSAAGGTRLTETGLAIGTPAYMSPEQAAGSKDLDGRSDVYSLGCVLYEMLSGETPYTGPTAQAILAKKLSEPLPRISVVRETVPPGIEAALAKALTRTPADRFVTAAEFAMALAHPEMMGTALAAPMPRWWRRRGSQLTAAATILAVAAVVAVLVRPALGPGGAGSAPIERLAVLPLTNLTGDTAQNYLVDGLHDLLITDLAMLPNLTVISRSSVMGYRNAPKPVPTIARELKVDAVVEGSVLRTGDTLRMTVQLIDGRSDRHLWADTYSRSYGEVLGVPPQAARVIAERLGTAAATPALARLTHVRAIAPQAADLFLKGRHFCYQFTSDGYRQGIQALRQAVDMDPTFAIAFAALGECYSNMSFLGFAAPQDAFPKAKAAAQQALALDSTLGVAYVTRALEELQYEWDATTAEADFARALQLSPGSMETHYWRSFWLLSRGRFDEALREVRRAIELDPLNMTTSLSLGWTAFNARRYDSSIAALKRTQEMDPRSYWPHLQLAWNYTMKRMPGEAVRECEQAVALGDPEDQQVPTGCAWVYAQAGKQAEARRLLSRVLEMGKRHWIDPYMVAGVYGAMGDRNEGFRWLDRAVAERSAEVVFLGVDPFLDVLRSDPRFAELQRRTGL